MQRSFLMVVLVFMCVLLGSESKADSYALVIGISAYWHRDIQRLKYAGTDAVAFRDVLVEYCGIPSENVVLLTDRSATKSAIFSELSLLSQKAGPADNVFLFYSGHGSFILDTDGDEEDGLDEVLLPYDAVPGSEDTLITDDELGWKVARIRAAAVLVILDTCHSGGQGKSANPMKLTGRGSGDSMVRDLLAVPGRPGTILLAACRPAQLAWESDKLGHGVLSYFVVEGLRTRKADLNGDHAITSDELAQYAIAHVEKWALQNRRVQNPVYENTAGKPVVVVRPGVTPPAVPPIRIPAVGPELHWGIRLLGVIPFFSVGVGRAAGSFNVYACPLSVRGALLGGASLSLVLEDPWFLGLAAIVGLDLSGTRGNLVGIGAEVSVALSQHITFTASLCRWVIGDQRYTQGSSWGGLLWVEFSF